MKRFAGPYRGGFGAPSFGTSLGTGSRLWGDLGLPEARVRAQVKRWIGVSERREMVDQLVAGRPAEPLPCCRRHPLRRALVARALDVVNRARRRPLSGATEEIGTLAEPEQRAYAALTGALRDTRRLDIGGPLKAVYDSGARAIAMTALAILERQRRDGDLRQRDPWLRDPLRRRPGGTLTTNQLESI